MAVVIRGSNELHKLQKHIFTLKIFVDTMIQDKTKR